MRQRSTPWQRIRAGVLTLWHMPPARLALAIALLVLLALCAGCTAAPQVQTVKVAVPVECREPEPDRPAMPTEQPQLLQADIDAKVAAALAELELREGYEGQLRAALGACKRPVDSIPTTTTPERKPP